MGAEKVRWTAERVARLKQLHKEGHTSEVIARTLSGVSDGAVRGKLHRLGLLQRTETESGSRMAKIHIARDRARNGIFTIESAQFIEEIHPDDLKNCCAYAEHSESMCTYIIGAHTANIFCNRPRYKGKSYCADHLERIVDRNTSVTLDRQFERLTRSSRS